jgi:hypothetical protein
MSHVAQNQRKRSGATGRISKCFLLIVRETSQKIVQIVYPIPIVHQKYTGPKMSPKSIPRRTSPPPTQVGSLSMIQSDGMSVSAVFSQKKNFIMSQKGKNKGRKKM